MIMGRGTGLWAAEDLVGPPIAPYGFVWVLLLLLLLLLACSGGGIVGASGVLLGGCLGVLNERVGALEHQGCLL